jgi:hypothetical protein
MDQAQRPVTRSLLASFIEYAAKGVIKEQEWFRFVVAHYQDPLMEAARVECARILGAGRVGELSRVPQADLERLHAIARQLRETPV